MKPRERDLNEMFHLKSSIAIAVCLMVLSAITFVAAQQPDDWFVVRVNGKAGYIDRHGKIVIEPRFQGASTFVEGLAGVSTYDEKGRYKCGFIDRTGNFVIQPIFDIAGDFSDGLAPVGFGEYGLHGGGDHKTGFIDKTGKIVIEPVFRDADGFSESLSVVRNDGKSGYIDKSGKAVIPLKFDYAFSFSHDLAVVFMDGKYGYINKRGDYVVKPRFSNADSFSEGLACVKTGGTVISPYPYSTTIVESGGEFAYINTDGKMVLNLKNVESAYPFSDGMARFERKGRFGFVDKNGKVLIKPSYFGQSDFSDGLKLVILEGKGESFGWMDKTGTVVLKTEYPFAGDFENGLASVSDNIDLSNAKWGYIDKTGKVIWKPTK